MKKVEIGSKNSVEVDCNMVKIHNFTDTFPHHIDLLCLRVAGRSLLYRVSGPFHGSFTVIYSKRYL